MDSLTESLRELPREVLKLIIFSLMQEDKVSFHELAEMQAKHLEALQRGATEQCQKIIGMIVNMHCDKKKNQEKNLKEIMHYLSDKGMVNSTHEQIDKKYND